MDIWVKSSFCLVLMSLLVSCSSTSEKSRTKSELLLRIGTNDLLSRSYTSALRNLKKAHKLSPDDSRILNNLGMAYYFKKRPKIAKKYLTRAIEENNKNSDAKNNLASILFQEKRYEEAEKLYTQVSEDLVYEKQYRTYYNLALVYQKLNQEHKSVSFLKKSSEENINYCPSHFMLGKIYFKRGNLVEARKKFKDSVMGGCYENPAPHYHLGLTYLKMENDDLALAKFEEIVNRFSKSKYSPMALAQISKLRKATFRRSRQAQKDRTQSSSQSTNGDAFVPSF